MVFINVRQLSKLMESAQQGGDISTAASIFQQKYGVKILLEEYETLTDLAMKINKREKTKSHDNNKRRTIPIAEIFTYGEYKLFTWTLLIYSFLKNLDLPHLTKDDFQYFSKIFKQKTQTFLQYEVYCLRWSKEKYAREWEEAELGIFQAINSAKTTEDWKSVSYSLFCQSQGRFFRPFQQCRERWINYSNPSVKKGDWSMEQDVQLFTFIVQYGCRWALISRELKGTRSEHSIKNRYNSVVRSMRKQYKITSSQQVEQKILKYLKFRHNRQTKGLPIDDDGGELNLSADSKASRERSRQVKMEVDLSKSDISEEEEVRQEPRRTLFDGVFDVGVQLAHEMDDEEPIDNNRLLNMRISESPEEKELKRTWEEEYEVIDGQISIGKAEPIEQDNWWVSSADDKRDFFNFGDYHILHESAPDIQPIMQVREDIQNALGCAHYERLMSDDWLFDGKWEALDE